MNKFCLQCNKPLLKPWQTKFCSNKCSQSVKKGKTIEEIFGEEKARGIKERNRVVHTGKKRSKESIEKGIETRRKNDSYRKVGDYKHTKETREKISGKLKGKKKAPLTEEHKRNIGLSKLGIASSKKGKNYEQRYGKEKSEKIKESVRKTIKAKYDNGYISPLKNRHRSKETKEKLSKALTGRKLSEKAKRNISLGGMGHVTSEETRRKIGLANTGKVRTEAQKRYWSSVRLGKYVGEKAGNWQGGLSFEIYPKGFNRKLKAQIRKRDNQTCQICKLRRDQLNQALSVHHIDYDKKNYDPENLIALCRKCHAKTSFNRAYWEDCFLKVNLIKQVNYMIHQEVYS